MQLLYDTYNTTLDIQLAFTVNDDKRGGVA